jgi:protein-tyrosine phosphatase
MGDNRFIKLEGTSNFREIGGLKTQTGELKSGILFRSDELFYLTANDLSHLEKLGIKLIIDLRTPNERKSKPDNFPDSCKIRIINIPFFHQKRDLNQMQIAWFLITNSKKINFEKLIIEHYMNNAFERAKEVGMVLTLISDEHNLPALIHCKAGKDRTGLIAALIQMLAGVPRETIFEEYLATNKFMKQKMEAAEKIIRRMSFFRISPDRIKPLLEVRREYLETVIDEILLRYGSIENYLISSCEVKSNTVEKLKSIILI